MGHLGPCMTLWVHAQLADEIWVTLARGTRV